MVVVQRLRSRMGKIPECVPVNREARMGISHKEYEDMSKRPSRFDYLSGFPELLTKPNTCEPPSGLEDFRGRRHGNMVVIGYVPASEKKRLGWEGECKWALRCDCGRYEGRSHRHLRKASINGFKREYKDACTFCKNAWAELVKQEFMKTGIAPKGGLPTHCQRQLARKRGESRLEVIPLTAQKPRIRIKMGKVSI